MIGRLRGTVEETADERVLLDVGGVGYEVVMSPKGVAALPGPGEPVTVHTHLHVRDDAMVVYGFPSPAERDLFRVLLGASGVGPKVAMAILGVFSVDALTKAVTTEDVAALTQVPGVGTRGAQKIILDLKPKIAALEAEVLESTGTQLRDALEGLGYTSAEIRRVAPRVDADAPLTEQIRQALRELAG